ncbi:hypothetical protein GCM10010844_43970 [Deinococcus radiotolerans]|uniref:Uncharacterized protein n=1 Tax=Deinococcus radiotolerans TaxID=1309407 RepID=A0ABQ2FRP5_9DEIO|nr:hypothetical protein GCM10010844_43970 [Deinococcus radiotolerans]
MTDDEIAAVELVLFIPSAQEQAVIQPQRATADRGIGGDGAYGQDEPAAQSKGSRSARLLVGGGPIGITIRAQGRMRMLKKSS